MMKLYLWTQFFFLVICAQTLDRFNYGNTVIRPDGGIDYGVADWEKVLCSDLARCAGYPETWWYVNASDWSIPTTESHCKWCPANGAGCDFAHHQSPISLTREVANPSSPLFLNCTDDHWMEYRDSSCTWDELKSKNAFSIERHALKVAIPIRAKTPDEGIGYRPNCQGGYWGRIDFSNGFQNWLLSHTTVRTPSEHTQNGKRYDAEIQLHHLYSQTQYQMSTIGIFVQAYDKVPDDPYLNKLICQWRKVEETKRDECGMPSVVEEYPGCWYYNRTSSRRNLRSTPAVEAKATASTESPMTLSDLLKSGSILNRTILFEDEEDSRPPFDVEEYLRKEAEMKDEPRRRLLDYDEVPWFNYWPMLSVRTEYYHAYEGTDTVPPCFGRLTRGVVNFWRIMKDPLRISRRQLDEMNRLLVNRIAPSTDLVNPCKPDTAGIVDDDGWINTARPLQEINDSHLNNYCECEKWNSKWPEDRTWCAAHSFVERLTTNPYNFQSSGF